MSRFEDIGYKPSDKIGEMNNAEAVQADVKASIKEDYNRDYGTEYKHLFLRVQKAKANLEQAEKDLTKLKYEPPQY